MSETGWQTCDIAISTTEYTGYDILGRVTSHKKTTDGTDYTTGYTYNLGGVLIEETYPSGRVVKNILDARGDLSAVQSKKNSTSGYWNYANSFTYNAVGAVTSMQLGNGHWESTRSPLVKAYSHDTLPIHADNQTAATIRPVAGDSGDREIEVPHELDGDLVGFGSCFWRHLATKHPDVQKLLNGPENHVVSVNYRDRYLFTPLSVALLFEVVQGLKGERAAPRPSFDGISIVTTSPVNNDRNRSLKKGLVQLAEQRNARWRDASDV